MYIVALVLVVTAACSKESGSPSQVLEAALMAANDGKYEELKKYQADEVLKVLETDRAVQVGGLKGAADKISKNGTIDKVEILEEQRRGSHGEGKNHLQRRLCQKHETGNVKTKR